MAARFPILYIAEADAEAAVLSSGALAHLVEAIPTAEFTIVGSAASAPLFADTPRLRRLIVLDKTGRWDWIALWNQVRDTKWGLVVDMRGTKFSERLRRQKRAVRGRDLPGLHAVEQAARILHLDEIPAPRLFFAEETTAAVDALIGSDDAPILAVGPGVDWMGKRWPAERFAKVAGPLLADDGPLAGGRLMIVGEDADRDAAHTIRLAVPRNRVIELQGKLTRLQTAAALSPAAAPPPAPAPVAAAPPAPAPACRALPSMSAPTRSGPSWPWPPGSPRSGSSARRTTASSAPGRASPSAANGRWRSFAPSTPTSTRPSTTCWACPPTGSCAPRAACWRKNLTLRTRRPEFLTYNGSRGSDCPDASDSSDASDGVFAVRVSGRVGRVGRVGLCFSDRIAP